MNIESAATLEALEPQALSMYVFREKYLAAGEQTHLDLFRRVAKALGRDSAQAQRILTTMVNGFIPGGRINASAGLDRKTTLVNCFVQPLADCMTGTLNGIPGIMDAMGEAAETMRQGGGVGYDFSPLRPLRARVKGTNSEASGPVSYMRVFDRMCDTVESAGSRRGAQMGVLRIDHPDVEVFIDAKKGPDFTAMGLPQAMADQLMRMIRTNDKFGAAVRKAFATLSNFNISVGVTDEFMEAVFQDQTFDLVHIAEPSFEARKVVCADGVERHVYRTVRARDLWNRIMRNAYLTGDPGIVFLDTINRTNNLRYCERIAAPNPCAEQPLPPYGCCDVGHGNLVRFVREPFTPHARFDWEAYKRVVAGGVELLDRVLDVTKWPLPQQQAEAEAKRRIGQGFTGLGSTMAMLGLRYGSVESAEFASEVARTMRDTAYRKSVELARELGSFPLFDADKYLEDGTFASTLPEDIKEDIRRYGIRNSHLLSIAPVGTGSLAFGDNCSSGIEPIFDLHQFRNVRTGNGDEKKLWSAEEYALRVLKLVRGENATDPALVTAQDLSVDDHLRVLNAVAPYIDAAVSKTVNAPREYPFEAFQETYMNAWRSGLKGITVYRPNDFVGSVLVSAEEQREKELLAAGETASNEDLDRRVTLKEVPNLLMQLKWPSRPDVAAEGKTYTVKHRNGNFAVVVNHYVNGSQHPLEVYIAGNEAPRGLGAIAKSLSVDMRTGDAVFLAMKLDSLLNTKGDDAFEMRDPASGQMVPMPSLTAGFAKVVKHRLTELGVLGEQASSPMVDALFSRREPKTGADGAIGWHVDINNPVTGDDFLLHTKEIKLPDGSIRPYSVWLSGHYPKVLDGLMKVLSIDLRISDPTWAVMKLRKLLSFGEVRGDFMAPVPGEQRQANYPSTVAYMAAVLLARMEKLGLVRGEVEAVASGEGAPLRGGKLLAGAGRQCPSCHAMTLHKVGGCDECSSCGYTGSCG